MFHADESAAQLTPKQLGQLNKELSTLQPVVDALTILAKLRQEVRHATSFHIIIHYSISTSFSTDVTLFHHRHVAHIQRAGMTWFRCTCLAWQS